MHTCRCCPRPSTPSSTTSPAFRKVGGFIPMPTPGGVPVRNVARPVIRLPYKIYELDPRGEPGSRLR